MVAGIVMFAITVIGTYIVPWRHGLTWEEYVESILKKLHREHNCTVPGNDEN
jgi:hypothetical protein